MMTGYVDNDAVIAQFYQDELSRVDQAGGNDPNVTSVVSQEWPHQGEAIGVSRESDDKNVAGLGEQSSPAHDDESVCSVEIEEEESWSEFGKRLDHLIPIAHVPKINGELPSEDEQISDHQLLSQRLQLYGLVENKIQGDGNCQLYGEEQASAIASKQLHHSMQFITMSVDHDVLSSLSSVSSAIRR